MVMKEIIMLDLLGLFCKAVLRIEYFVSVKVSLNNKDFVETLSLDPYRI